MKDELTKRREMTDLSSRSDRVKSTHHGFPPGLAETVTRNREFSDRLQAMLNEFREHRGGEDSDDFPIRSIDEIEALLNEHKGLVEQLVTTHRYLEQLESNSRQLYDELQHARVLSITDELTGLPNRRAFLQRIDDEVARVQRYDYPLSMILIDLDHFKGVNDRYGHAGGDTVLELYAKNVLSFFRHHDLVARYGGEEFAVLLPNTDSINSIRALKKVRKRAREIRWENNGRAELRLPTFSAGVSIYQPGESVSDFINRADKALYRAKQMGRDRVETEVGAKPLVSRRREM